MVLTFRGSGISHSWVSLGIWECICAVVRAASRFRVVSCCKLRIDSDCPISRTQVAQTHPGNHVVGGRISEGDIDRGTHRVGRQAGIRRDTRVTTEFYGV